MHSHGKHGKHVQDILSWEVKEEWVGLPHKGFCAAGGGEDQHCKGTMHRRRSCLSHQIPAAQDSSTECPLLGWLQLSCLRMAWARSSSVLHLGATAGMGNAGMPGGQAGRTKAVTPLFPNFNSARWACRVKAKHHHRTMETAALKRPAFVAIPSSVAIGQDTPTGRRFHVTNRHFMVAHTKITSWKSHNSMFKDMIEKSMTLFCQMMHTSYPAPFPPALQKSWHSLCRGPLLKEDTGAGDTHTPCSPSHPD